MRCNHKYSELARCISYQYLVLESFFMIFFIIPYATYIGVAPHVGCLQIGLASNICAHTLVHLLVFLIRSQYLILYADAFRASTFQPGHLALQLALCVRWFVRSFIRSLPCNISILKTTNIIIVIEEENDESAAMFDYY